MEPELCAATHHENYDFDEDCCSEKSLDFPDSLENEFQTGFWKSLWSQGIRVSTLTRVEGSTLSLSTSATTTAAEHITSTPPEHAICFIVWNPIRKKTLKPTNVRFRLKARGLLLS